jgi:hypothetical protein
MSFVMNEQPLRSPPSSCHVHRHLSGHATSLPQTRNKKCEYEGRRWLRRETNNSNMDSEIAKMDGPKEIGEREEPREERRKLFPMGGRSQGKESPIREKEAHYRISSCLEVSSSSLSLLTVRVTAHAIVQWECHRLLLPSTGPWTLCLQSY